MWLINSPSKLHIQTNSLCVKHLKEQEEKTKKFTLYNQIASGLSLFVSNNNICFPINVIHLKVVSLGFYTVIPVAMTLFVVFH